MRMWKYVNVEIGEYINEKISKYINFNLVTIHGW